MGEACKKPTTYERHRPEYTLIFKVLLNFWLTFKSQREAENLHLPQYVTKEIEAFLTCGLPQYGFLRLQCKSCDEEKIVAFSCKKKGFCISCAGKRQVETATHLIDNVLPFIPYRQIVISFPKALRYWINANKDLYSKIHRLAIQEINSYYCKKAVEKGIKEPKTGSITFSQRFGSAAELNPHLHILCADGIWHMVRGKPKFKKINKMTEIDAKNLTANIATRIINFLKKKGYLDKEASIVLLPGKDTLFEESELIQKVHTAYIGRRIARQIC